MFGMKLYMFRTVPLSIIRSFSLYTQQWYMSYRFAGSLRAGRHVQKGECMAGTDHLVCWGGLMCGACDGKGGITAPNVADPR